MQDAVTADKGKKGIKLPSIGLIDTRRVIQFGLYVVILVIGINVPWVRQYIANATAADPLVGIGYWVLGAFFSLVLVWNIMRNIAAKRRGIRIGVELALVLFWAAWISWLTNDRMNAGGAFEADRLGVVINVFLVGLYFCLLAVAIVMSYKVIDFADKKLGGIRKRQSGT